MLLYLVAVKDHRTMNRRCYHLIVTVIGLFPLAEQFVLQEGD